MKYHDGQLLLYIGTLLPLWTLIYIVIFVYTVYMKTYLVPLLSSTYQSQKLLIDTYLIQMVKLQDYMFEEQEIILLILLHGLMFLFLITLYRVVNTLPGSVPTEWINKINEEIHQYIQNENMIIKKGQASQTSTSFCSDLDEEQRIQLNIRAKMELIDKQGRRFCKNCQNFKPKRCHHCRQCKKCWLKMDHHCQWLNNCIGDHNYKLFINLLGYGQLLLTFIVVTYSRCYYDAMYTPKTDFQLFLISFTFLFSALLCLLLTAFTIFHLWAIASNITTLEYCENKSRDCQSSSVYQNFISVFGSNPLYWFIPVKVDSQSPLD